MGNSSTYSPHKNGRPTTSAQTSLRKTLREYFEDGISASSVSEITGTNIKTISKYYDEWTEQILESETADFLERQKKDRAQAIILFDMDIIKVGNFLNQIESEIKLCQDAKKEVPKYLFGLKLDAMKYRSTLIQQKSGFLMQPTFDEALEKKIQDKINQYGQSGQSN